ncbi:MAG: hypothetical protein GYB65_15810 [Chloroflexi bacterium]|nr:hypothetical protein [Chloroflexota bacterium]
MYRRLTLVIVLVLSLATLLPAAHAQDGAQNEGKTITFEISDIYDIDANDYVDEPITYRFSITVPETWYAAIEGDEDWETVAAELDTALVIDEEFASSSDSSGGVGMQSWASVAVNLGDTPIEYGGVPVVETDTDNLSAGGFPTMLMYNGVSRAEYSLFGSYECAVMEETREALEDAIDTIAEGTPGAETSYEYYEAGDGLCGARIDMAAPAGLMGMDFADEIFDGIPSPTSLRLVEFFVPLSAEAGVMWQVLLPNDQFEQYAGALDLMVESASIEKVD